MLEVTANQIVNALPNVCSCFTRSPDFGPNEGLGWYVEVIIKNRHFLIKGQGKGRLTLREVGLGPSGINWKDLITNGDFLDIKELLEEINSEMV